MITHVINCLLKAAHLKELSSGILSYFAVYKIKETWKYV